MAQTTHRSRFFIGIGSAILFLANSTFICGVIQKKTSKLNGVGIQAIVYSLYMIAPGVLCVITGWKRRPALSGATLALNIVAVIASSSCLYISAKEWKSMNNCYHKYFNYAYCKRVASENQHIVVGAITICSAIMAIMSLIGSIYGCVNTCPCCSSNQSYAHLHDDFSEPLPIFQVETGQQAPRVPPYVESSTSCVDLGMTQIQ
ncbi:uncharacterized protein LOC124458247 isoform X1 [Xenia sp. Carnegie-2017]|uniref:uncharacterized protein LOC124458247 isoform X1 n=1 Tax=Xenia sp. Carnegie-2017 TaxID=2897299 RepID=UPI001F03464A|nr:uncharacterized protein LOC124458247 isoform X1 [Xenia sp. Carnegie-2017]